MLLLFEGGEVDMGIVHVPCRLGLLLLLAACTEGPGVPLKGEDWPVEIVKGREGKELALDGLLPMVTKGGEGNARIHAWVVRHIRSLKASHISLISQLQGRQSDSCPSNAAFE